MIFFPSGKDDLSALEDSDFDHGVKKTIVANALATIELVQATGSNQATEKKARSERNKKMASNRGRRFE